jgi:hypothetical protein
MIHIKIEPHSITRFIPIPRAVNGIILAVYPIRIVPDKTGIGKILFSLGHQV